ncbi:GrpB protein-domain-containing protein [Aspergillus taichungensis]|uniref:GrpB protein-domain-containing protein n=1 Tax=Aspergillus taichungensis TaxID=482145 RepID=A0A2J5HZ41_9EURO|nr:GrpB protein-domain-containing protein [Aspergillus taichungensis]
MTPHPITERPAYNPLTIEHVAQRPHKPIEIVDSDPTWPAKYALIEARIRSALGNDNLVSIAHVGSTSVPDLPAKDIVDVDVVVPDPDAEDRYIPALEAAGFRFLFREPDWHRHRFLYLDDPYANVHVFGPEASETIWHRMFRDWLLAHEDDRVLYAGVKREAARASREGGETVMQYNDRKEAIITLKSPNMRWSPEVEATILKTIFNTQSFTIDLNKTIEHWPGDDKPTLRALEFQLDKYRKDPQCDNTVTFTKGAGKRAAGSSATSTPVRKKRKVKEEGDVVKEDETGDLEHA